MKKHLVISFILGILYVGLLVLFTYLSLSSGTRSSKTSGTVSKLVADFLNLFRGENDKIVVDEEFHHLVRKLIGHFGYFVVLGIVSFFFYTYTFNNLRPSFRVFIHFISGFVFAFLTEFVFQALAESRGPSFVDVLIDYSGFFISIILATFYMFVKKKRGSYAG